MFLGSFLWECLIIGGVIIFLAKFLELGNQHHNFNWQDVLEIPGSEGLFTPPI